MVFHDPDLSWEVFLGLEATSGEEGWKVRDTLGRPLLDLDQTLWEDLLLWRSLVNIVRKQKLEKSGVPDASGGLNAT